MSIRPSIRSRNFQNSQHTVAKFFIRMCPLRVIKVKVNQSHYRPEVPRGFQEVKVPRLRDNGPEWWYGCQPYEPAAFYPHEILLVLISVRGWVDPRAIVRSEGLCKWKIPMTPSGIEPATLRFVTQHLNHCAAAVPALRVMSEFNT